MRGTFLPIGIVALFAALALPAAAFGTTRTLKPTQHAGSAAIFRLSPGDARLIVSAHLAAGQRRARLDVSALQHSVRRNRVNVTVPARLRLSRNLKLVLKLRDKASNTTPSTGGDTGTPAGPGGDTGSTTPPTGTPSTGTNPPPATVGDPATVTIPVAGPALADTAAAALVSRDGFEPRPANATTNHRTPTAAELSTYRSKASNWGACDNYHQYVTGDFTGTTDEVLQWAALKWGLSPDLARATAVVESNWLMSAAGDGGVSFGLLQIKSTVHGGTAPLSYQSSAYNADFWAAMIRYYYDGCAGWLNGETRGQDYAKGDLWGSIGAWYAGRWHTQGAEDYIVKVKAKLSAKPWAQPGF